MSKSYPIALLAGLACLLVFANDARAGVTVDVLFQDGTGSALTIAEGDEGPGCAFNGYYGNFFPVGRCMDVVLRSTYDTIGMATHVTYESDNGLALAAMYEWRGTTTCHPPQGLEDNSGSIGMFDCIVVPPNAPPQMPAGTYRLGTIIWDTSGTTEGTETIAAYIDDLVDGFIAVINGDLVLLTSADIVVGSAVLTIVPEPGTAALLGLGLVGLVLTARRRRA